jgi:hypothetical protein
VIDVTPFAEQLLAHMESAVKLKVAFV